MDVAACLIVKDEASILDRCLTAAAAYVDRVVVVDTGSSDDTVAVAERHRAAIHEIEFVDFGQARTDAVRLASPVAEWLLLLDADDELLHLSRQNLENPSYLGRVLDGGPGYTQPRLIRTDRDWQFVGKTHEYLTATDTPIPGADTEIRATLWHHCDGSRRPRKFVEDLALLRVAFDENPDDPRTVFYLANTLRDLGFHDEALPLYWMRARMGGWHAEARVAAEQAARIESGDLTVISVPSHVAA